MMQFTRIVAVLSFSILVPETQTSNRTSHRSISSWSFRTELHSGTIINDLGFAMFILPQDAKDLVLNIEYVNSKSGDSARQSGIFSCIAWPKTIKNTSDGWMDVVHG